MAMTKEQVEELLADDEALNEPEKLPMGGTRGSTAGAPPVEQRRRREALANLLISGYDTARIVDLMTKTEIRDEKGDLKPGYGMGEGEVHGMISAILAEWEEEDAERRRYVKMMAERRLLREISEARGDKGHTAIANLEKVLMMVQGTAEPIEVNMPSDARVSEALLLVLGELEPARIRELVDRGRAIDAEGVTVRELRELPGGAKKAG